MQQLVTCGATTFAREEVFMHAYHAMLPILEKKGAPALLVAQLAISAAKVGANIYRQTRLEHPDKEVAVRGHFGLSNTEWQSKSAIQKAQLTAQHETDSRNITRNQLLAETAFFVMSLMSHTQGDGALAVRVLSTQLRNLTYAASRETLQASTAFTASTHGIAAHGVNAEHMAANGWTYTAMTLAMSYLQDAVIGHTLPAGQSVAGPALSDASGKPLSGAALNNAVNLVAGVRSMANTATEFMDAFRGKHYDLEQVGDTQKIQTDLTKLFPLKDYGRLLDHSFARLSWNNISGAMPLALDSITKGKVPPAVSQFINNAGSAAMFGMTYRMVNQSYQAHAKMRAARAALEAGTSQSVGAQAGSGVIASPSGMRILASDATNEAASSTDAAGPGPSTLANRQRRGQAAPPMPPRPSPPTSQTSPTPSRPSSNSSVNTSQSHAAQLLEARLGKQSIRQTPATPDTPQAVSVPEPSPRIAPLPPRASAEGATPPLAATPPAENTLPPTPQESQAKAQPAITQGEEVAPPGTQQHDSSQAPLQQSPTTPVTGRNTAQNAPHESNPIVAATRPVSATGVLLSDDQRVIPTRPRAGSVGAAPMNTTPFTAPPA
ncbi:hypothetical protein [Pseudomonas typographi]|uniref:hypothetical protein n=1 Tax=Pseudomonas typographi TaxID=2715964 RepID=UPI001685C8FA|nr:hypothetical protein [Pseudomonas typographi]MBD1552323.1 hypothetical protein [Pseudomonas typographi]MBD1589283.1 hypothetical protein [Pseudomonas typographi]